MRHRTLLIALLFFTVVWGLLLFTRLKLDTSVTFWDDARKYSVLATHLLEEGFYSEDGITPHRELEPGYSGFLALTYLLFGIENRFGIFFAQGLLYIVSVLFFLREFGRIASKRATIIALIFFITLPSIYHTIFSVYRESVVLSLFLLFSAAFLSFLRTRSSIPAIFSAVSLSAIILTYIPFLLLPFFLLFLFFLFRTPVKFSALIFCVPFLLVFFWGLRNAQYGDFRITGNQRSTSAHWLVRADHAERWRAWDPLRCIAAEYVTRSWTAELHEVCKPDTSVRVPTGGAEDDAERDAIATEAKRRIVAHVPSYLFQSLFGVLEYHLPFVNGWGRTYNVLEALMTGVLYLGGIGYLWFVRQEWKKEHLFFLLILLYGTGIFSLFVNIPRFHMPVIFTYIVVASLGYDRFLQRAR